MNKDVFSFPTKEVYRGFLLEVEQTLFMGIQICVDTVRALVREALHDLKMIRRLWVGDLLINVRFLEFTFEEKWQALRNLLWAILASAKGVICLDPHMRSVGRYLTKVRAMLGKVTSHIIEQTDPGDVLRKDSDYVDQLEKYILCKLDKYSNGLHKRLKRVSFATLLVESSEAKAVLNVEALALVKMWCVNVGSQSFGTLLVAAASSPASRITCVKGGSSGRRGNIVCDHGVVMTKQEHVQH